MAHTLGYARISTADQDSDLQDDALTEAGCVRVFTDTASGKLDSRPQLHKLLEVLLPGDTVVVWRLDRLGRSLKHLIEVVTELGERHVAFRSITEAIDTSTAGGRLLFHIMGALAEFERQLISERTHAGLTAARRPRPRPPRWPAASTQHRPGRPPTPAPPPGRPHRRPNRGHAQHQPRHRVPLPRARNPKLRNWEGLATHAELSVNTDLGAVLRADGRMDCV